MSHIRPFFIGVLLLLSGVACQSFTADELAFTLIQAKQSGSPTPLVTEIVPRLTPDEAYYIQQAWLSKMLENDVLLGFKAGATSVTTQERFDLKEPVGGLLLESGRLFAGDTLKIDRLLRPMMEAELGFRLNGYISEPFANVDSLKNYVDSVFLVVEIPDLGFESTRPFNAADLIAANVGAAHTIIPVQGYAADSLVWKGLRLGIQKDGEAFIEGLGSDVLGDPWQAVLWLANHYIERDYVLGKGQILITGAIGTMKQAEKGAYTFLMNDEAAFSFYLD